MTGALIYLVRQTWKNSLLTRIRRLKQPKYLVGSIFGGLYFFYFFFYRIFLATRVGRGGGARIFTTSTQADPELAVLLASAGALVLFVILLSSWVLPGERAGLVFSEAEVAFLLPAPLSRRMLIHWKLLRSQVGILLTSVFFTLVFGWFRSGGAVWTRALGWWLILSTMNLHFMGASFARTMLLDAGISNWKRRVLVLGLVAVVGGGAAFWVWHTVPELRTEEISGIADIKNYAGKVFLQGPLYYLLLPFRWVVRPYLAPNGMAFLKALGPALALLGLHYAWVVKSDVAFEEASIEASRKMAEKVAAMRAGKRSGFATKKKKKRAPFTLKPVGLPAMALLWKNLIGAGSAVPLRFWLMLLWGIVAGGFVIGNAGRTFNLALMAGTSSLMLLGMSFLVGPQAARQDFRQDLPMADLLKTYPLPSWQLALGELLAPAVILTAAQWCLIVLATLLLSKAGLAQFPLRLRLAAGFALAVVAPGLNLLSLMIPNAAVLLFPGWFQAGKEGGHGIELMGQRMVFAFGQLVVLVAALAPAGTVGGILYFLVSAWEGPALALPVVGVVASAIMLVEAGFGLVMLGRLFEKVDVSADGG